jgi:hypothetical protein
MGRSRTAARGALAACAAAVLLGAGAAAAQADALRAERGDGLAPGRVPSDLDLVNPGIGFGWFGLSDIPVGGGGGDDAVSAPVLGIRWWMGAPLGPFRTWGIDLGVGLARSSRDTPAGDVTRTGLLLHGGMPLAVSVSRHVAIEFIPELDLGFARGEEGDGTDLGGTYFQLGGRAGAEVFFGFIGLPQLALEASVGIAVRREERTEQPPGGDESSAIATSFGTTVRNQPWDIFRSSVAARYYF